MIDVTLAASVFGQEPQTGAGGTATLAYSFFGRNQWLRGQQVKKSLQVVQKSRNKCTSYSIKHLNKCISQTKNYTNSMVYGIWRLNAAFTRALQ